MSLDIIQQDIDTYRIKLAGLIILKQRQKKWCLRHHF